MIQLEKQILREIGALYRCFEGISNIEFREYGLAKNQYVYLVRICENPGTILERICEELMIDRSTASRSVEKLCVSGFVYKKKYPCNLKNRALYPTEKGLKMYEILKTEEEYSDQTALGDFSEAELRQFYGYLKRMRMNITPDWKTVKKNGARNYPRMSAAELFFQENGGDALCEESNQ
ncbi:MAG: winged helix-turn-helix transcriptional regulator [Oscillibacter sp.]|nr:winged helix-turn-helix transcriptional regulator [Oscillibacter sp.]